MAGPLRGGRGVKGRAIKEKSHLLLVILGKIMLFWMLTIDKIKTIPIGFSYIFLGHTRTVVLIYVHSWLSCLQKAGFLKIIFKLPRQSQFCSEKINCSISHRLLFMSLLRVNQASGSCLFWFFENLSGSLMGVYWGNFFRCILGVNGVSGFNL